MPKQRPMPVPGHPNGAARLAPVHVHTMDGGAGTCYPAIKRPHNKI